MDGFPARMSDPIEPRIAPLCAALNAIPGVKTLYSCEGHWQRNMDPYVLFRSSLAFAGEFNARLIAASPELAFFWRVSGMFLSDRVHSARILQFKLTVQGRPLENRTLLSRFVRLGCRNKIDHDLVVIERIVRSLGSQESFPPVQVSL
ncbi:MAG: hypothetical protein QJR02_11425 [Sinobacteraceae bacterium]|nr:hypothetical protein [Nevskiaceae bacterium]